MQSQRFEGPTLAKAKANAVRELTDDRIASIEAIRDLTPAHVAGEGSTQEEALQAAKKRIPSDAIEVEEPRVTKEGDAGVVTVEKEEEMEARNPLRGLSPKGGARLGGIECVVASKKGFLGIGKRMGQWKTNWTVPFRAELDFKQPAVVEAILKEAEER